MAGPKDLDHVKPMMFPSELARRGRGEEISRVPMPDEVPPEGAALMLRVRNTAVPDARPEVLMFQQPTVSIGRSKSCDARLDDPRQVVSGRHASLSLDAGVVSVTDLGSRNLTYLDGKELTPNQAAELPPGSTLLIGDFEIQVETGASEPEPTEPTETPTVFEPAYQNPFLESASSLGEVLEQVAELYAAEAPARRDEALREALASTSIGRLPEEFRRSLARLLDGE